MNAKLYVTGVLFTLAAFALAAPARAIDGGVPDYDGHPNVGLLAWDADGDGGMPPYAICTGSVISDHAFLTAAHCIEPPLVQLPPNVEWAVTLAPGTPSDPLLPGGFFPFDYPEPCCALLDDSQVVRATEVVVDPDYDPESGLNDLAVLVFPAGTFTVTPVELPSVGFLDNFAPEDLREGPQFTLVGYGAEIQDGAFYVAGYRKTARAPFRDLEDNWLLLSNTGDDLPQSGKLCYGDSGSPQFFGGSNIAVSLLHDGGVTCDGESLNQRLDTVGAQAFLAPYLQ